MVVDKFINELEIILKTLHDTNITDKYRKYKDRNYTNNTNRIISYDTLDSIIGNNTPQITNNRRNQSKNYNRIVKRLKHKLRHTNTIIQRTDKSKIFHLGRQEDYLKKSDEHMEITGAYKCLDKHDPLPELIQRTNSYLLKLRLKHLITQKQYESLVVKTEEVDLAHLYYLPKVHKQDTPLRPIVAGMKHPTIKISRMLDKLLRPLFNKMAATTTVTSGTEVLDKLEKWSVKNLRQTTTFCTLDVCNLYTMIPQIDGVLSFKKMLDKLNLKHVSGLSTETIIKLSRYVLQNNYFTYNSRYYHQIRGGAMGSPLTLTMANCYMYFYELDIIKQITNSGGIYMRYIDDIFIVINWPTRHLHKQINIWNNFNMNIKLNPHVDQSVNFLDITIENKNGQLFTKVYHKPSHEPYFLPYNSIHPLHIKKNIPFAMLLRSIKYCSTFEAYLDERETIRMALLLNKYPNNFIDNQFNRIFTKYNINTHLTHENYTNERNKIINKPITKEVQLNTKYNQSMYIHFTYCTSMVNFPKKFNELWKKYFEDSPINDINPILCTRNTNNLQLRLTYNR